jgi:hypothetical protein
MLIVDDKEYEAKENTSSVIDSKEYTKSVQFRPAFIFSHFTNDISSYILLEEFFCTLCKGALDATGYLINRPELLLSAFIRIPKPGSIAIFMTFCIDSGLAVILTDLTAMFDKGMKYGQRRGLVKSYFRSL